MLALLWGRILPTKRKMALSEGSWIRFLMIHMNWATDMSLGTRNFFLSMSGIEVLGTFSTITGILSGYLVLIFADSAWRLLRELSSLNCHRIVIVIDWSREESIELTIFLRSDGRERTLIWSWGFWVSELSVAWKIAQSRRRRPFILWFEQKESRNVQQKTINVNMSPNLQPNQV